jgi:hypothetical protein
MKKILLSLVLLSLAGAASAQRCCYRPGFGWGPALIGGVIGYELAQPHVVVQPVPVVVAQPQVQLPPPPVGQHWQLMFVTQTNAYQYVLVPN